MSLGLLPRTHLLIERSFLDARHQVVGDGEEVSLAGGDDRLDDVHAHVLVAIVTALA